MCTLGSTTQQVHRVAWAVGVAHRVTMTTTPDQNALIKPFWGAGDDLYDWFEKPAQEKKIRK